MATEVGVRQILRLRLSTQRLARRPATVLDVSRQLLAVQAQDFGQALWALGVRAPGASRSSVLDSLARGDIVRSLPMRGTLFFVPAEDLGWMLRLTATRTLASIATRQRGLGLDQQALDTAAAIARQVLGGGNALGRAEFFAALEAGGISPSAQRGYHIILHLSQLGLICWGPPSGTQQALVLVDEWITSSRKLERDQALGEFVLRYFTGHGPATLRDFCWWSKVTVADARIGFAVIKEKLTELSSDGTAYYIATSEIDTAASRIPRLQMLAGFDEYVLGYHRRDLQLPPEHADKIVPGQNGMFMPTIVADGRVVGTWRRSTTRNGLVSPIPFESLESFDNRNSAAFATEAGRYAEFIAG